MADIMFGGYPFDSEVFGSYTAQEAPFSANIIASGAVVEDATYADMLANGGSVGSMPFYNPLDPDVEGNAPLVRDGSTDNVPVETKGGKQSFIRQDVMKAWKTSQLTRELTGADPLGNVAASVENYYRMVRQGRMLETAKAIMGVAGLESHKYTATDGVTAALAIDAAQQALGDCAGKMGLFVINSKIAAEYRKIGLIEMRKYTIPGALEEAVELPTVNGMVVLENDRGTDDGTNYLGYMLGEGAFVAAYPPVITPDYADYDPKTDGGTDVLYTNRSFVLHPNGLSFVSDNIAGKTPTLAEIKDSANWALKYDAKNVRIGQIIVPKAQLA